MGRIVIIIALLAGLAACMKAPRTPRHPAPCPAATSPPRCRALQAKQLFGAKPQASGKAPDVHGGYAKGCLAGGCALPDTGPTWQAMRLSRNRNWGHPETIDFVKRLSRVAATQPGWNGLYVGDISQPRGGPMLTGHRSHQSGMDADIWLRPADI